MIPASTDAASASPCGGDAHLKCASSALLSRRVERPRSESTAKSATCLELWQEAATRWALTKAQSLAQIRRMRSAAETQQTTSIRMQDQSTSMQITITSWYEYSQVHVSLLSPLRSCDGAMDGCLLQWLGDRIEP